MKIALISTTAVGTALAMCLLSGIANAEKADQVEQAPVAEPTSAQASQTFFGALTSVGTNLGTSDQFQTCRAEVPAPVLSDLSLLNRSLLVPLKKCSFNSDCSHGKCKSGSCGGCSFTSDCKGWGKCAKNKCGACSFDSECKGFGKCNKGKCTKSPYKK